MADRKPGVDSMGEETLPVVPNPQRRTGRPGNLDLYCQGLFCDTLPGDKRLAAEGPRTLFEGPGRESKRPEALNVTCIGRVPEGARGSTDPVPGRHWVNMALCETGLERDLFRDGWTVGPGGRGDVGPREDPAGTTRGVSPPPHPTRDHREPRPTIGPTDGRPTPSEDPGDTGTYILLTPVSNDVPTTLVTSPRTWGPPSYTSPLHTQRRGGSRVG